MVWGIVGNSGSGVGVGKRIVSRLYLYLYLYTIYYPLRKATFDHEPPSDPYHPPEATVFDNVSNHNTAAAPACDRMGLGETQP